MQILHKDPSLEQGSAECIKMKKKKKREKIKKRINLKSLKLQDQSPEWVIPIKICERFDSYFKSSLI